MSWSGWSAVGMAVWIAAAIWLSWAFGRAMSSGETGPSRSTPSVMGEQSAGGKLEL